MDPIRILVIDNYDSFTYNLVHQLAKVAGISVRQMFIFRNDSAEIDALIDLRPSHIVLSPGPGTPEESKATLGILNRPEVFCIPVLGVCLGHQALVVASGGVVERAIRPLHGQTSHIYTRQKSIFSKLPDNFEVARYHSLIASIPLPDALEELAVSAEGEVMALQHRHRPWVGVQFHPESFLTQYGDQLVREFFLMKNHSSSSPSNEDEPRSLREKRKVEGNPY